MTRTTIAQVQAAAGRGERLAMITAYDYTSAVFAERAGVDLILVGDSVGMVVQGHGSTLPVTLDQMVYHSALVTRGCTKPLVVADLPFASYVTPEDAVRHGARLMAEAGVSSVKLEGGRAVTEVVRRLVQTGIPVMGHLGFTPQSVNTIGTRVQAKHAEGARQLIEDARALVDAGAWAIVLELIPAPLAAEVTRIVPVPTIGIGAGVGCSGEVQVWHDVLGLYPDFVPRHTRQFRSLGSEIVTGLGEYVAGVKDRSFPTASQSATMDPAALAEAVAALKEES